MKFVALGPWSCQSCLYNLYQLVVFVFCLNLTKWAEQFTSCQVTPASLLENKNHGCSTHAKVKEPTTENVRNQELLVYLPSIRQEIRNASVPLRLPWALNPPICRHHERNNLAIPSLSQTNPLLASSHSASSESGFR